MNGEARSKSRGSNMPFGLDGFVNHQCQEEAIPLRQMEDIEWSTPAPPCRQ